jgi:hypothetical protein
MLDGLLELKRCYETTSDKLVSKTIMFFVNSVRLEINSCQQRSDGSEQYSEQSQDGAPCNQKKKRKRIPILSTIPESSKDQQEFFRAHWSEQEINVLFHLVKELNNSDSVPNKANSIVKSIEELLEYKDSETRTHITNTITYS